MSEGAPEGQDKSFDPTPGRLEKAREEGDIALSREVTAAASYAGLYLVIVAGSGALCLGVAEALARMLEAPDDFAPLLGGSGPPIAASLAGKIGAAAAALFAAPAIGVIAAIYAQQGFVAAPKKLSPKWSRLSIVDNAKQKFGPHGLTEFAISAFKLIAILTLFGFIAFSRFMDLPPLALAPAAAIAPALHKDAALFIGAILLFSAAVGAVDVIRVRLQHKKKLMMTLEDIRREAKETEGDPHFKQARRERSKAIATNRMLLDVPKANVVIVNPEHYAVALKWDGPKSGAPVCVAKGVDQMAAKIRDLAAANGVPIRRDAPTARAIYKLVEVGAEIRREHYAAVAAAIHFADAIRAAARAR